jgi:3-hydroxybutyryl-CoA dehydrogenase
MKVGVIGAGTMGSGIAQVAAQAGHSVVLYDAQQEMAQKAVNGLKVTLDKLVGKGKLPAEEAAVIHGRIKPMNSLTALKGCGLVIEAIVENLAIKKKLFQDVEDIVKPTTILATNTSSLSVTAIAAACAKPERVIGLHFFNPAPLLPLVEVVPGLQSDPLYATKCIDLMRAWGKTPVVCKDTPGFIVNRVARPFYGESIRIFEEGLADMPTIDRAMKELGGFRMGPFELMDLIGNDINFTVTKTVWESFFFDPRYKPSFTQQRQVEAGWLGRKTGRGYYRYDQEAAPSRDASAGTAGGSRQAAGPDEVGKQWAGADSMQMIVDRVVAMLINEAVDALHLGVASRDDIDLAMTKGVNYPKGLLKWADELGPEEVLSRLESLQTEYGEDRYRPSPLLRRMVREGRKFY